MFMSYLLEDEPFKFFLENVSRKVANSGWNVQIMNAEFNPPIHQQNMFNGLIRVSIENFMKDGKTEAHTLRGLILGINWLTSIARTQERYDEQRMLFFETAVAKTMRVINVVSVIADGSMTYRALSTKLVKAQAKYATRQELIAGSISSPAYRKSG